MAPSIGLSVAALALMSACSPSLQVGLANAPAFGKDTTDTRVHSLIANGRDACERSGFPPGEVLRGQIPPCPAAEPKPVDVAFFPEPRLSPARTPWRGLGACVSAGPGFTRAELSVPGESLASRDVACDEP